MNMLEGVREDERRGDLRQEEEGEQKHNPSLHGFTKTP